MVEVLALKIIPNLNHCEWQST